MFILPYEYLMDNGASSCFKRLKQSVRAFETKCFIRLERSVS